MAGIAVAAEEKKIRAEMGRVPAQDLFDSLYGSIRFTPNPALDARAPARFRVGEVLPKERAEADRAGDDHGSQRQSPLAGLQAPEPGSSRHQGGGEKKNRQEQAHRPVAVTAYPGHPPGQGRPHGGGTGRRRV